MLVRNALISSALGAASAVGASVQQYGGVYAPQYRGRVSYGAPSYESHVAYGQQNYVQDAFQEVHACTTQDTRGACFMFCAPFVQTQDIIVIVIVVVVKSPPFSFHDIS